MKNLIKIVIVALMMICVIFALKYASNFEKNDITDRTNLVLNYTNVTSKMKGIVYIEDGIIYLSKEDIKNYYDEYIFFDEKYNRIITTSDECIAYIQIDKGNTTINNSKIIEAKAITKDNTIYIPISKLEQVYNVDVTYINDTDTVVIESLDRECKIANAIKKTSVKYKNTVISKTIEKIQPEEEVTIIPTDKDLKGWVKIRTENGKIGYVQEQNLTDIRIEREAKVDKKQIDGNISLVWEYFSEYSHAPERQDAIQGVNVVSPAFFYLKDGELKENVGSYGEEYIQWAHENNYKIWPMIANNTDSSEKKKAFSEIVNDSKLRLELINQIVEYVEQYNLDGINLDFENMYESDKAMFSRFIIELAPRLKNIGVAFSVDVTAPDGSPDWSLCFDRNVIGDVVDYIVFMAYDQNGVSSDEPGTVAGYDWVEKGINKFLGQEGVSAEKIILGIPFYTRVWRQNERGLSSAVVSMRNIEKNIPNGVEITWDENCKQNYMEYEKLGTIYKMWIEDEKSIEHKLNLVKNYNLAGAGFWVKGFETENIWELIEDKLEL